MFECLEVMRSCSSSALVEKILGFSRYGHLLEKLDMIESFLHFGVFRFPLNLGTLIGEIQEAQNYDEWAFVSALVENGYWVSCRESRSWFRSGSKELFLWNPNLYKPTTYKYWVSIGLGILNLALVVMELLCCVHLDRNYMETSHTTYPLSRIWLTQQWNCHAWLEFLLIDKLQFGVKNESKLQ